MGCSLKTCSICRKSKPLGHYALKDAATGARRAECKDCHNARKRAAYKSEPRRKKERIGNFKARQAKVKAWFEGVKSQYKCVFCSENSAICLDFHHVDPDTKVAAVSELVAKAHSQKAILEEIAKCIPICSNCHRKLHLIESANAPGNSRYGNLNQLYSHSLGE